MADREDVGTGELSRQIRDVLARFQDLATRLETQFMRSDTFVFYQRLIDAAMADIKTGLASKASIERLETVSKSVEEKATIARVKALEDRVEDLEDDKKWLIRLVSGFIILGVLGAVFAVSQLGGSQ